MGFLVEKAALALVLLQEFQFFPRITTPMEYIHSSATDIIILLTDSIVK
jgi:hypothetical protein